MSKKNSKKVTAKKSVKIKIKNAVTPIKNVSNNFRNYNLTRSSVKEYLQSSGLIYNGKEITDYASKIYREIKKESEKKKIESQRNWFLENSFKNIDVLVGQHFYQPPIADKIKDFDWWSITEEVDSLAANTYIIVDNSGLLSGSVSYFEGKANDWSNLSQEFNHEMNTVLQREEEKYYKFVKIFFRSDAKQKEFFFFILVHETSPLINKYGTDEIINYVKTNNIFDIDETFNKVLNITVKSTLSRVIRETDESGYKRPSNKKKGHKKGIRVTTKIKKRKKTTVAEKLADKIYKAKLSDKDIRDIQKILRGKGGKK